MLAARNEREVLSGGCESPAKGAAGASSAEHYNAHWLFLPFNPSRWSEDGLRPVSASGLGPRKAETNIEVSHTNRATGDFRVAGTRSGWNDPYAAWRVYR
jgi:hypothetical protein